MQTQNTMEKTKDSNDMNDRALENQPAKTDINDRIQEEVVRTIRMKN